MKIDFEEIKEMLQTATLTEVSRRTGIAYRTLQDWKLSNNKWLIEAEERLTKLQKYINEENGKMRIIELEKSEVEKLKEILEDKGFNMDSWGLVLDDSVDNIGGFLKNTDYRLNGGNFKIEKK